jgi:hypothetical protein
MKKFSAALLFTLVSSNSFAHGIGSIDCKDWYKNPLVAVICGVGAVIEAPFALMEYVDEKGLKKNGISRIEGTEYNEYSVKKSDLKFVIFNLRSPSLQDAQQKCASVNGRIATREESDLLDKGSSHDADILYSRLYLNFGPNNKVLESATTGFVEGVEGKDVFLYFEADRKMVYKSSAEVMQTLDASNANHNRANFDSHGILQPICVVK